MRSADHACGGLLSCRVPRIPRIRVPRIRSKYLLFQLSALLTASLLLVVMIPLYQNVLVPQRQQEQAQHLVAYTGFQDYQAYLPSKDKPFNMTEKQDVGGMGRPATPLLVAMLCIPEPA